MTASTGRAAFSAVIGLMTLVMLADVGDGVHTRWHLLLPGPLIGLVLLSLIFYCGDRQDAWTRQLLGNYLAPISRVLVAHMGLLFAPAGVGIIALEDAVGGSWLPIVAGLLVSTVAGLISTAWIMQRFFNREGS